VTKPQPYRQVAAILRANGWEKTRQRGSHETWKSLSTGQVIIIVNHRGIVSPGIIRQIQQQLPNTPQNW